MISKIKSKKTGKKMKVGVTGGKLKRAGKTAKKASVLARTASRKRAGESASARFR